MRKRTSTHPRTSPARAGLGLLAVGVANLACAQAIPIEKLDPATTATDGPTVLAVMKGEVPGVVTDVISVIGPARHSEPGRPDENVMWFILGGRGTLRIQDRVFPFAEETIARAPLGWPCTIAAAPGETVLALRVRKPLNDEDRAELPRLTQYQSEPYVKAFRACTTYGEAIKSAKTVSRTLLPEAIVPRMAAGTVETVGPDEVGRHQHPMLEQLFVGLRGNDCSVSAGEANVDFPELSILHIPLGSMHGARVGEGKKLHYIWLDFFGTKAGQEWLKMHKPVTEKK